MLSKPVYPYSVILKPNPHSFDLKKFVFATCFLGCQWTVRLPELLAPRVRATLLPSHVCLGAWCMRVCGHSKLHSPKLTEKVGAFAVSRASGPGPRIPYRVLKAKFELRRGSAVKNAGCYPRGPHMAACNRLQLQFQGFNTLGRSGHQAYICLLHRHMSRQTPTIHIPFSRLPVSPLRIFCTHAKRPLALLGA